MSVNSHPILLRAASAKLRDTSIASHAHLSSGSKLQGQIDFACTMSLTFITFHLPCHFTGLDHHYCSCELQQPSNGTLVQLLAIPKAYYS